MGLICTRKELETVHIGDDITITVIRASHGAAKLDIDAPGRLVMRDEIIGTPEGDLYAERFRQRQLQAAMEAPASV